jgi:hypothetical protein
MLPVICLNIHLVGYLGYYRDDYPTPMTSPTSVYLYYDVYLILRRDVCLTSRPSMPETEQPRRGICHGHRAQGILRGASCAGHLAQASEYSGCDTAACCA